MAIRGPATSFLLLFFVGFACASEPSARLLQVSPQHVQIGGMNRQQQLLITAVADSGERFDVTHRCRLRSADPDVADLSKTLISGKKNGATELIVQYAGLESRVPVNVAGVDSFPPVHFVNDIIPLFSKLGCNGAGCHGKQAGQNGFKLSVFGFDPQADFSALVHQSRGRRVFPAAPDRSLLLLKATGLMPHGGGRRFEPDSLDAQVLREWIAQGTPWNQADAAHLVRIEIEPQERIMRVDSNQQILVTAVYSDDSRRDVTHAAHYTSNADLVAEVDPYGTISTGKTPGEAAVTINYMGHVGATRVLVPRPSVPEPYPDVPANNHIDELVWLKLRKLGITPSELADDATFLRRLHLDSIGTLPTPEQVRSFLQDPHPDKRRQAIDRVLDRDEFADYWALKWSDVLLVNSENLGARGAFELHRWLRQQIADNRPYDEWVGRLLTATGNSGKSGPVNFYRAMRTPQDLTKTVSQAFLGIRLDCAQCHHHPYEKWGQEDFYGLAGYFNGLKYEKLSGDREFVFHAGHQPAKMPLTGEAVATRPLGSAPAAELPADPRIHLAQWMTAPDNPWFARLAANRLWKHYLGRGLVEPEDDIRSTNPATNEPLLQYLAEQVVANDYDLKAVMRLILNSRVYQLSSNPNDMNFDDEQNFSHHLVRRLPAEVLLDAISQVTGSPEHFAGAPLGTRSIELWDNRLPSYFLDTFGRSERESPCECAKSSEPTMAQALHLMNAPEIEAKIADENGRVAKLLAQGAGRDRIVAELCIAALGREPADKERKIAGALFAQQAPQQAAQDFVWTLLNSYEFLFVY